MVEDEDDSFIVEGERKSSRNVLAQLKKAERAFNEWQATCDTIDDVYGRVGDYGGIRRDLDSYGWSDSKLDLFWASYEILKPAVYAKPPVPAVAPLFKDGDKLKDTTAELLERVAIVTLKDTEIDYVMRQVRDDLIFTNRGVPWVRYDTDDGQHVCIEHLDRNDFTHEPARYWSEVGWVARRAWLTRKEMRARFRKHSGDAYKEAKYELRRDDEGDRSLTRKAGVWEVWHKADGKVYWATEGVEVLLDSGEPDIDIRGFFPCPRPAYGTLERRTLVPVPDWQRYALHFSKISQLTGRIYLLLDQVKMKGLIPAGGDVGTAIEQLLSSDDDQLLIPVPGAALVAGTAGNFVQWMPLTEIAQAITGLIEARGQLINDFYELSGISDIMRGATEAEETLGAQQLKSQYGSVRVRDKIDELQRVAADCVRIASEIIAEKFTQKNLLDMSQMPLLTKDKIKQRIKDIEKEAEAEMQALAQQVEQQAAQSQEVDPQALFQEGQQQLAQRYAPMLVEAEQHVPVEDVVSLLRDDRTRSFTFEIETDSTILTDELQEKASRTEFMSTFMEATNALMPMASSSEEGAVLAGEMLKFVLAPYRAGRQLQSAIDAFVDKAPELAAQMAEGGDSADLVEANNKLAEAEMVKGQAAMQKVQADSQLKQAELQTKMADLQQRAQNDQQKAAHEQEKLQLQLAEAQGKLGEQEAKINLMQAQTAEILSKIGLDVRKQDLEEYKAAEQTQQNQVDTALKVGGERRAERGEERADRGEERADRQQGFSEQQAQRETQ